jgi:hypothetical protein
MQKAMVIHCPVTRQEGTEGSGSTRFNIGVTRWPATRPAPLISETELVTQYNQQGTLYKTYKLFI